MPLDDELSDAYDVVIVGSGFGGSVMAAELADYSDAKVCVLERGNAYAPGAFPRDGDEIVRNFWAPEHELLGLYDVRWFSHITAVVASGLGGGSLIYANVMLRKDGTWFQQRTPNGEFTEQWALRLSDLDEHYGAVEDFLGVEELPHEPEDAAFRLEKTSAFLGPATDREADDRGYTPLAIRFRGKDGVAAVGVPLLDDEYGNIHGTITRNTCCLNGECDVGCNEGAKSSLDHTYLSLASCRDASVHTRTQVVGLKRIDDADGYRFVVTARAYRKDGSDAAQPFYADRPIKARRVVLAAGSLGSTELLLQHSSTLGLHHPALGSRFSGNGDFLAAVQGTGTDLDCWKGPVITAYRRYPAESDPIEDPDSPDPGGDGADVDRHGMYIQDAGLPNFAMWRDAGLLPNLLGPEPAPARIPDAQVAEMWADTVTTGIGTQADPRAAFDVTTTFSKWQVSETFMPLLGMGRDRPDGRLSLGRNGRLDCDWRADSSEAYFDAMNERMAIIAEELGGTYVSNPLYDVLKRVITVHPVGGCPMDTNLHEGVIDTYGRVRGVPGLRVCDGSVFPGPIGPNPSLTIAAFARRSAHNLIAEQDFNGPPTAADAYEGS